MTTPLEAALSHSLADRYALGGVLGRGGMAVVYDGEDLRHRRRVAIKVLSADVSSHLGAERFTREIRTTSALTHPHIVPVFDSGEAAGLLYFVMPRIEGETLRARLQREGRLPIADAVRITKEIADALTFAHANGVVHRDVKPENILLANGHALLADFGIARDARGGEGLTGTGVFIGTPEYLSPEAITGEVAASPSTDVYALGSVLYEMLSGVPPFRGPTVQATLAKRLAGSAPPVRAARAEVPVALDAAVSSALATDPSLRCPSCEVLARAIGDAMRGDVTVAMPDVSLVVRPFDPVGGDAELADFTDGLTEEVIGALSKIRGMRVIARTSAVRLKGADKSARAIGHEYAVRYVVTGSVRRAGAKVRVACEVVDAVLDAATWADRFDGNMEDPFLLQETVARGIAGALDVQVTLADAERLRTHLVPDPRAADCARRALVGITSFSREGLERGTALARQGLELVGPNAPLYAALGIAEFQWVNAGFDIATEAAAARRLAAAAEWFAKAEAINPDVADLQFGLGWVAFSRGDLIEGVRRVKRAKRIDPSHVLAESVLAVMLWSSALWEELDASVTRALALDPFDVWGLMAKGILAGRRGDGETRDAALAHAASIAAGPLVYALCGLCCAAEGDFQAAEAHWSRGGDAGDPEDFGVALLAASRAALRGDSGPARAVSAKVIATPSMNRDPQWALIVAQVTSLGGDAETAIELLARATAHGLAYVDMLERHDRMLDAARAHPAFPAILARARLNDQALRAALAEGG